MATSVCSRINDNVELDRALTPSQLEQWGKRLSQTTADEVGSWLDKIKPEVLVLRNTSSIGCVPFHSDQLPILPRARYYSSSPSLYVMNTAEYDWRLSFIHASQCHGAKLPLTTIPLPFRRYETSCIVILGSRYLIDIPSLTLTRSSSRLPILIFSII